MGACHAKQYKPVHRRVPTPFVNEMDGTHFDLHSPPKPRLSQSLQPSTTQLHTDSWNNTTSKSKHEMHSQTIVGIASVTACCTSSAHTSGSVTPILTARTSSPILTARTSSPILTARTCSPILTSHSLSPALTTHSLSPVLTTHSLSPALTTHSLSPALSTTSPLQLSRNSAFLSLPPPHMMVGSHISTPSLALRTAMISTTRERFSVG